MGFFKKWKARYEKDPEARLRFRLSLTVYLIMSPAIFFLVVKLIGPDWLEVHFSQTQWRMGADVLVEEVPRPFLFFKLSSDPPGWEAPWNRILVLDAEDGATLGTMTDSFYFYVRGVTPREVWVQYERKGDGYEAFSLPDMDSLYTLDDLTAAHPEIDGIVREVDVEGTGGQLHLDCRDGRHYLLDPRSGQLEKLPLKHPGPKPSLLYRDCNWPGPGPVHDKRSCTDMKVGDDTIWLDNDIRAGRRTWFISRRAPDGTDRWQTTEDRLFGARDDDDPALSYDLSVVFKGRIYLSAGDGLDFYVAALDAETGAVIWSRTFW